MTLSAVVDAGSQYIMAKFTLVEVVDTPFSTQLSTLLLSELSPKLKILPYDVPSAVKVIF